MSKESYARGFCKAAAAAGVDPVALAKYAQYRMTGRDLRDMHPESAELDDPYLAKVRKYYKDLHPESAELDVPVRTPAEVVPDMANHIPRPKGVMKPFLGATAGALGKMVGKAVVPAPIRAFGSGLLTASKALRTNQSKQSLREKLRRINLPASAGSMTSPLGR